MLLNLIVTTLKFFSCLIISYFLIFFLFSYLIVRRKLKDKTQENFFIYHLYIIE